jgi:AcrR family transcriptional regulator
MQVRLPKVVIRVNEKTYLKDPETSDLGKRILSGGIDLIDELGFENFTFRKLAKEIKSSEASIYRYFESKHKLLLYFASWYWAWLDYRLDLNLANVSSAQDRLERVIRLITDETKKDSSFSHINEIKLNQIVISDFSKSYLTKNVDQENKEGAFLGYKHLVSRISDIVFELNPAFSYPHMLITTVIEGAHMQRFFARHLPKLTDQVSGEDSIQLFYTNLVFNVLNIKR